MTNRVTILGKRYGKLVVTKLIGSGRVLVQCDCGNTKEVWQGNLQKRFTSSCGCEAGTQRMGNEACLLAETWLGILNSSS